MPLSGFRAGLLIGLIAGSSYSCARRPSGALGPEDLAPSVAGHPWNLPVGFPIPLVPADNPMSAAKVELGRRLFYDTRLSGPGNYSCASCHQPQRAFTDGRAQAVGATGQLHPRSTMSLANVAYSPSLTWADPKLQRLEDQALIPLMNEHPLELGMAGREEEVVSRFAEDADYRRWFREAFPGEERPASLINIRKALASFERTLLSFQSPYDRYVFWGEHDALSESAKRGMEIFFSESTRCSGCHSGANFSGPIVFQQRPEAEPTFHNTGLYNLVGKFSYPSTDTGLHQVTGRKRDVGRFRAPTLRNIALTAPYMHDGSVDSLEEVIDHYASGGRRLAQGPHQGDGSRNPLKSRLLGGFSLSPTQKRDLVEFLNSLTDPAFANSDRFSDPWKEKEAADSPR